MRANPHATLGIVALVLSTGALVATAIHTHAQQGPAVAVDPASQTVALDGGPFDVRVTVDDVTTDQGLGGYTLVMTYDQAVVEGRTITDSGFVASTGNGVVCPASGVDNKAGRLAHLCFTIPVLAEPGPQTSEPQVLATVRFEPVAEGTSLLDISETTLIDPQGTTLSATATNGQVTVRGGTAGSGAATASATEHATANPTLPSSGEGPNGRSSDSGLRYVWFTLIGIGGVLALATVLLVRRRGA